MVETIKKSTFAYLPSLSIKECKLFWIKKSGDKLKTVDVRNKEIMAKYGIKLGLDIAEGLGLISKTTKRKIGTRKRGCSNADKLMLCFICPNKYGKRNCKGFRKYHNMKVGLFLSGEDVMGKITGKMI